MSRFYKTCLACFLFLACWVGKAQSHQFKITLTVFSEKGERFWLVINGVKQNQQALQSVKVPDLTGNAWKAQVVFENEQLPEVSKNIYIPLAPTQDAELVYQVKRNRKGVHQLRLFSSVGFPNPLNEAFKGLGDIRLPNFPDVGVNFPNNPAPRRPHEPHRDNRDREEHRDRDRERRCQATMSDERLEDLREKVDAQMMEDTKQNVAKQAIGFYCVSSQQARQILRLFGFEQTRLEFAKWVYDYVYDPQNFYVVNDVFNFSMSVDELQEYIKHKR